MKSRDLGFGMGYKMVLSFSTLSVRTLCESCERHRVLVTANGVRNPSRNTAVFPTLIIWSHIPHILST